MGGRSLGVFGSGVPSAARPLADALGIALQQTNILRDIREDLGNGGVYLPAEDLERYGSALRPERVDALADDPKLADLMRFEAQRALGWYATGLRLLPLLDRRTAACTGAMAGIYRRLLAQIAAAPALALRHRQSLPGKAKAMVAARALAGIAPRVPAMDLPGPGLPAPGRPAPAPGRPAAGGPPAARPPPGAPPRRGPR